MKRIISIIMIAAMLFSLMPTAFADNGFDYVTDKVSVVIRGDAGVENANQFATFLLLAEGVTPSSISSKDDILGISEIILDSDGKYETEIGLKKATFEKNVSKESIFVRIGSNDITETVIEAYTEESKQFFHEMKIVADEGGRKAVLSVRAPENYVSDSFIMVGVQYDKNGALIAADVPDVTIRNGGDDFEVSLVPVDGAEYCKVFAWYKNLKPLVKPMTGNKVPKEILVIGNSFSVDSVRYVNKLADSMGIDLTVHLYQHSGGTVNSLYEARNGTTASDLWYYAKNSGEQNYSSVNPGVTNPTLDTFLSENTLDAVVIQHFWAQNDAISQYEQPEGYVPDAGKKNFYPSPSYVVMAEYIKEKQPDAEIIINGIWSNEHGYYMANYVNGNYAANGFDNASAFMYDLIEKYNGQASIDIGATVLEDGSTIGIKGEPVRILPVGYAIQYARNWKDENGENIFFTEKNFEDYYGWEADKLYPAPVYEGKIRLHRDGYHLSPAGRYLAGCVWIEMLTGLDVRKSSYKPEYDASFVVQAYDEYGNTVDGKAGYYYDEMDDATAELIRTIAHEAVEKYTSQPVRGLDDPSLKY